MNNRRAVQQMAPNSKRDVRKVKDNIFLAVKTIPLF